MTSSDMNWFTISQLSYYKHALNADFYWRLGALSNEKRTFLGDIKKLFFFCNSINRWASIQLNLYNTLLIFQTNSLETLYENNHEK